jgi:hypothetical protein
VDDKPRLIIGFGYRRRSGKDTCCTMARDILIGLRMESRIDHFAYSIKEGIGRGVFGFSNWQLYGEGPGGKEEIDPFWGISPRYVFSRFGTEVMHTLFGKDIWIRTLIRRAHLDPRGTHLLIGDVRFPTEAEAIKEMGGLLVHVDRPGLPEEATHDEHSSETSLANYTGWDYTIHNDVGRTLEQLRTSVQKVLQHALACLELTL